MTIFYNNAIFLYHVAAVSIHYRSVQIPFLLACHRAHKTIQISIHSILHIVASKFYRAPRIHYRLPGYYNLYLVNVSPMSRIQRGYCKKKVYARTYTRLRKPSHEIHDRVADAFSICNIPRRGE